jgi:hypothetical protein
LNRLVDFYEIGEKIIPLKVTSKVMHFNPIASVIPKRKAFKLHDVNVKLASVDMGP